MACVAQDVAQQCTELGINGAELRYDSDGKSDLKTIAVLIEPAELVLCVLPVRHQLP